jgi:hypothetical protein
MSDDTLIPGGPNEYIVDVDVPAASSELFAFEDDLKARLIRDYGFKPDAGALLRGLCPSCRGRTLTADRLRVYCSRTSKCGWDETVPALYPDLYDRFSERYPVRPDAPNATAEQYLRYRFGFDPEQLAGLYTQASYWNPKGDRGTATVRIDIAEGVSWEHFIDSITVRTAAGRNIVLTEDLAGDYEGHWWSPGDLSEASEIWIVASPFDALALHLAGVAAAAAILKADNYPAASLQKLAAACMGQGRPDLVWALGSDAGSVYHIRKWIERARAEGWPCEAAQIAEKPGPQTWASLHIRNRLGEKDRADYRHYGALLIAKTAFDKALLIYKRNKRQTFHFDHENALYWWNLDAEKFDKATKDSEGQEIPEDDPRREDALKTAGTVTKIANCLPTPLYYQRNDVTDESWYYFRIDFPHAGQPIKTTFTNGQISSAPEFKKRLLHMPGAFWKGTPKQLDVLMEQWVYGIKQVKTIDFVGYAKEHRAYIYQDVAVKDGKLYRLNDEDYFDLPGLAIKTLSHSPKLELNTDLRAFRTDWFSALWTAFGAQGVVALAFWLGALFAEQIAARQKTYPFLEVIGEAGSGKSTLIHFLWKLLGRDDWEGFDPTNASQPAIGRNLAQVGNLPIVLMEGDRTQSNNPQGRPLKGFDWAELKKVYNRQPYRSRGVKNSGNETYEPPFRGAIVIEQNLEVVGDQAVIERLIHMVFSAAGHTQHTRAAAEKLETTPMEDVSGFLVKAAIAEKEILAHYFDRYAAHERTLQLDPAVRKFRIIHNHAQMMALVDCLDLVIPISDEQRAEARGMLIDMAIERQQAISQEHPLVDEFWDIVNFIEESADRSVLNHSRNEDEIAINLVHFYEVASARRGNPPQIADLKRVLKTSKNPKFVERRAVNSAIYASELDKPKTVKCWVFERK